MSLLLTMNILGSLFWAFLLTVDMEMADGILYWFNLNLSMYFRVGSRILSYFKLLYNTQEQLPGINYFLPETAASKMLHRP